MRKESKMYAFLKMFRCRPEFGLISIYLQLKWEKLVNT